MSIYIRRFPRDSAKNHSLTYSVKDIFFVKGYPCSFGVKPEYISCAKDSSPIIETLNTYFTLIGAVNLSPLCLDSSAQNPFFGDGHVNDEKKALYGSSFGSALSVATDNPSDKVDFSIGSDSGGSIRAPAAGLGLCSIRLKSNSVSKENSLLLKSNLDSVGIIADQKKILKKIVRKLIPEAAYIKSDCIYIPHRDELSRLSEDDLNYFYNVVERISHFYEIKVCSKDFFSTCFNKRKQIIQLEMKNLLFQNELQEAIESIPQAKALKISLLQLKPFEDTPHDFELSQNSMLLHPTLSLQDPINFYLPAANVLDLFSISFQSSNHPQFSLCMSGHNDSELFDFIDKFQM